MAEKILVVAEQCDGKLNRVHGRLLPPDKL